MSDQFELLWQGKGRSGGRVCQVNLIIPKKRGGVAPVSPRSAGAVRVGRSKTKNPNNDGGNMEGEV